MKKRAFTILELLIAISISGIIVTGMMQVVRNAQKVLTRSRTMMQINKSVCLFFNQIERDFNTAIIPTISEKITPIKKDKDKKDTKKEEKPKDKKKDKKKKKAGKDKKKEFDKSFFLAVADEDETRRIDDEKYKPFIKASFVNTNPLQVWGQQKIRFVRVGYELIKNKKTSTKGKTVFDLHRKETTDLKNQELKLKDEEEKAPPIRTHIVATNIKEMFIKYLMPKPKEEKKKKKARSTETQEAQEILELFSWGKTKDTNNVVPQQAEIRITFWGDRHEKTYSCIIPIFSYPTEKKEDKKKAEAKKDKKPGDKKEETSGKEQSSKKAEPSKKEKQTKNGKPQKPKGRRR